MFAIVTLTQHEAPLAVLFLLLGSGFLYSYYPAFWAIPTMMLGGTAAAATLALVNSIGQLCGLAGDYTIGGLNYPPHPLTAVLIHALVYVAAGSLILC